MSALPMMGNLAKLVQRMRGVGGAKGGGMSRSAVYTPQDRPNAPTVRFKGRKRRRAGQQQEGMLGGLAGRMASVEMGLKPGNTTLGGLHTAMMGWRRGMGMDSTKTSPARKRRPSPRSSY